MTFNQNVPAGDDSLLPARQVLRRYGIWDKTLDRWTAKPELGFPPALKINKRRYWRIGDLVAWERARAARGS